MNKKIQQLAYSSHHRLEHMEQELYNEHPSIGALLDAIKVVKANQLELIELIKEAKDDE